MRPALVAFGHLLVQNAAAGRHPLHVAGGHAALVAQAVAVRHLAGQHIRDGLDSPVRMPGKARQIIRRIVVAKIVQQQERIELRGLAKAEGALQFHARAFDGGFGFKNLLSRGEATWLTSSALHYWMREKIFVATDLVTASLMP